MEPVLFLGWRKPKGPGEFASNPSAFGVVRWINIGLAKALDLVPNLLWQNDFI
jgi:hypothetical protein